MRRIRVLIIIDEAWNDKLYGNNNTTNWFSGFDKVELATIYCSPEMPHNDCCEKYYQITDSMMLYSLFGPNKAGRTLLLDTAMKENSTDNKVMEVTAFDRIKKSSSEFFRLCRDILWLIGRYDIEGLTEFINKFKPDVIFSQRMGSVKICRLERIIQKIARCPIIAFTGDNEYSLHQYSFSPFFWIRRFMVHQALNRNIPGYALYYTSSQELAAIYHKKFGVSTALLFKCGKYNNDMIHKQVHNPIRIIYAGKLYCGRWKTLASLTRALKKVNISDTKIVLDIYTRDKITDKQKKMLDDGRNSFIKGAVTPDKIQEIYDNADIALHVESFDIKNRLVTQHSYSTKVIDCLSSGCAVMVIGWEHHSACIELKKSKSAFVITSENMLDKVIKKIDENPEIIIAYAKRAMKYINKEHSKDDIQNRLYIDFLRVIKNKRR